jgi:hypothetical protein
MTKYEYYLLEELLGKLHLELKHRYCIIPGHLADGYHIAIYNTKNGDVKATADAATIMDAVAAINTK